MPYSTPSTPATSTLPVHSNGRPGHRRSFSNAAPYAGAFQSLGSLPRARITPTSTPRFQIGSDNDDDDDSDDASDSPPPSKPDLTLKVKLPQSTIHFPRVSITSPTGLQPVSFLERSTTTSPAPFTPPTQPQSRPSVARTTSSPIILLSNGKPLKSSLKSRSPSSSSTSLSTCSSTASLNSGSAHTRAVSAPNTPHLDNLPSPLLSEDEDGGRTPSTPKNVHFAPPDSLRNIRVFSRSAKPAAISSPGAETETETDGTGTESERFNWTSGGITWGSGKGRRRWNEYSNTAFPFPKIPPAEAMNVAKADQKPIPVYTLSPQTTPVPTPYRDPSANIHIESIKLVSLPPSSHPTTAVSEAPFSSSSPAMGHHASLSGQDQGRVDLEGTVLVRNISFEKSVYIRFTLDGWQTTSEVAGHHVRSLSCLPGLPGMATRQYAQSAPSAFQGGRVEWDRFEFKIPLSDYPRLEERTLWLVARYVANHGEHWDNNRNDNYKIQFEKRDIEDAMKTPTLNGTAADSGVVDPAPVALTESPPTPTGSRQRHSLAPIVTVPLTLPSLPRSVRRRQVESVDVDSDAEPEHVPLKSNVDAPKVSMDEGSRERSGSLTSPEAVQVMQNALGKLNLKNYARPRSITSPSFFTPPSIATRPEPASVPQDDKSTVTFPASSPQNQQPAGPSGSDTSTPDSSPVLSTPPLSRTTSDASKEVRWPWGESTVTSPTSSSQDPNKGYAALIQQWCFATTPDTRDSVEVA